MEFNANLLRSSIHSPFRDKIFIEMKYKRKPSPVREEIIKANVFDLTYISSLRDYPYFFGVFYKYIVPNGT